MPPRRSSRSLSKSSSLSSPRKREKINARATKAAMTKANEAGTADYADIEDATVTTLPSADLDEEEDPNAALQKWSSDIVKNMQSCGFEEFDQSIFGDVLKRNAGVLGSGSSRSSGSLSGGRKGRGKAGEKDEGVLNAEELLFPFQGKFTMGEVKDSLEMAFANVKSVQPVKKLNNNVSVQPTKKVDYVSAFTAAAAAVASEKGGGGTKRKGGGLASIDDAWAKIGGGDTGRKRQKKKGAVQAAQELNALNGGAASNTLLGPKSMFSAGAQDIADRMNSPNLNNEMQFSLNEQMLSVEKAVAEQLSKFGSGSGSGKYDGVFDGHLNKGNLNKKEAEEQLTKFVEEMNSGAAKVASSRGRGRPRLPHDAAAEEKSGKKKRKVTKTNVPRVEIQNERIAAMTEKNKNIIVKADGTTQMALPPRKKGRRPNNHVTDETEEEKRKRAEERVYKNRQSAARSRVRKLKDISELEAKIDTILCENDVLRKLVVENGVSKEAMEEAIAEAEKTRQEVLSLAQTEKKSQDKEGKNKK